MLLAVVWMMAVQLAAGAGRRRYTADTAARYTDPDTSWGNAPETSQVRSTQLDEVEAVLVRLGGATAYELAQHLPHLDLGVVSARLSQLVRTGRARRTDTRRRTRGHATATVVVPITAVPAPPAVDPIDEWITARSGAWGARQLATFEAGLLELPKAGHGRRGALARLIAARVVGKALHGEPVDLVDARQRLARALRDARSDDPTADVEAEARRAFRAAVRPMVGP